MLNSARPSCPVEPQPQRHPHLEATGGGQVAQVEDVAPAELSGPARHASPGGFVVAGHEDRRVMAEPERIDHHLVRHGRLNIFTIRALRHPALQLFGQRVGVADEQRGRESVGEVQRIRGVDHHFAVQRRPDRLQGGKRRARSSR